MNQCAAVVPTLLKLQGRGCSVSEFHQIYDWELLKGTGLWSHWSRAVLC